MKWRIRSAEDKYKVFEERHGDQDVYMVVDRKGRRYWYPHDDISIPTKADALRIHISMERTLWTRLKSGLDEWLAYLFAAGWRTCAVWFALHSALYSWEPYRALTPLHYVYHQAHQAEDARKQILWLVALALAQIWIGMAFVELKDNKQTLFIIIGLAAYMSVSLVQHSASELIKAAYGSPSYVGDLYTAHWSFYIGVGMLLLGPWIIWRKRDWQTQI